MCYSHFSNEDCNGAISITQWVFINDCYKVNPVGQWGKVLVMATGFVDHLGLRRVHKDAEVEVLNSCVQNHRLCMDPGEEITFTARPKINSHSKIFRYGRSIFCLPHRPKFSDFFDLCLHWVSIVRVQNQSLNKKFVELSI